MISDRQFRLLAIMDRYAESRGSHLKAEYVTERQPWFYTDFAFYADMARLKDLGYAVEHPRRGCLNQVTYRYEITTKGRDALKGIFCEVQAQGRTIGH